MLKRYFGDKVFNKRVFHVVLPIIVQSCISVFVGMLDNIMVGWVGNVAMSAVSITNQLMFVYNIGIFGATSGAGIFTAQFYGAGDSEGVRYTFRYKMLICSALTVLAAVILLPFGEPLSKLYLQGDGDPAEAEETLRLSLEYLEIMLLGMLPFAVSSTYSSTLRECKQTVVPMVASISAVVTNTVLNYILIFGKFGAPVMGVRGAAIATVVSRFVEMGIVVIWTHVHGEENPFIRGAYRSVYIPGDLLKKISVKGLPLLLNETLYSFSTAITNQCYSTCGLNVLPALNILSMVQNICNIAFGAFGTATGIILGQELGAGRKKEAVMDTSKRLLVMATFIATLTVVPLIVLGFTFPYLYNTTPEVCLLTGQLSIICAVVQPMNAYTFMIYYTLRSGGKVLITIIYDSLSLWLTSVPAVLLLSNFTNVGIIPMFCAGQLFFVFKMIFGTIMFRKGTWIQNLVKKET